LPYPIPSNGLPFNPQGNNLKALFKETLCASHEQIGETNMRSNRQFAHGDVWLNTINCLRALSGPAAQASELTKGSSRPRRCTDLESSVLLCNPHNVRVVDRTTPNTALIEWSDATLCRYGSQLWQASVSKRAGVCAMSGTCIKSGDLVYKPRSGSNKTMNSSAMICAKVVHQIPCDMIT
jgi:hypothetical protein